MLSETNDLLNEMEIASSGIRPPRNDVQDLARFIEQACLKQASYQKIVIQS